MCNQGWLLERTSRRAAVREICAASSNAGGSPPGDDGVGSAWHLPESSLERKFNTCSFQRKQKTRWFKPSQFAGRLEGLEKPGQFAKVCRCPAWVKHEPLLGKSKKEAREYPEELAALVAQLVVNIWKRVVYETWQFVVVKIIFCARIFLVESR